MKRDIIEKDLQIEIMKFFLDTSIPRIMKSSVNLVNER